MLKNAALDAKIALIQLRTSLRKGLKNGVSKGPRWLYRGFATAEGQMETLMAEVGDAAAQTSDVGMALLHTKD